MLLSIILLTWNSENYIKKCIDSVLKGTGSIDCEIIIVDNGSVDNTVKILNTHFPTVKLIKNLDNKGVAPARNQGIREAEGEYILILDIDTQIHGGAIQKMLSYMGENCEVGLCGPLLCFVDGAVQNSFRRFPLVQTKILRRINAAWARRLLKDEYYEVGGASQAREVDYVIGACQMIRRSALDKVGLLDEKIFYGPEDIDICLRLWLTGWRVAYLPEAKVTHYEQRVTKKKLFSYITFRHIQGLVYYFRKHRYMFSRKSLYNRITGSLLAVNKHKPE